MIKQYARLLELWQLEYLKYSDKPTKASSKRLRDLSNQIKKESTAVKQQLMLLDKEGY